MTSRDISRTDKPLAPIDNILNTNHVPVYRKLRVSSLRKKSMSLNGKLHLYDFETEGNENKGKRFKKSQKVRKRARIYVRHNKENTPSKHFKTDSKIFNGLHKTVAIDGNIPQQNVGKGDFKRGIFREIQTTAEVHNGFSPLDDDILSVTSEHCDDLTEDEIDFYGFTEDDCRNQKNKFLEMYGQKLSNLQSANDSCHNQIIKFQSTPNPYKTSNARKTPIKLTTRSSFIPVIEFNESMGGNQLQPNCSSENIDLNQTFQNISFSADKRYSTPVKHNSFNSSSFSNLSINDLNATNYFGFEDCDNINEEFLISPIKYNASRPVRAIVDPVSSGPSRPQLPSVPDIISRLKEDTKNTTLSNNKRGVLFAPEIEYSPTKATKLDLYLNNSSLDFISQDLSHDFEDDSKILKISKEAAKEPRESQVTPVRLTYERPHYLRHRKSIYHEDRENEIECLNEAKSKKQLKNGKKKIGPSKKEVNELEKWAQAFNSQCAQVDAFNLCIE